TGLLTCRRRQEEGRAIICDFQCERGIRSNELGESRYGRQSAERTESAAATSRTVHAEPVETQINNDPIELGGVMKSRSATSSREFGGDHGQSDPDSRSPRSASC